MRISTLGVGAAVTPTVIETWFSHYLHRKPLQQKPTAHISYHVGLQLIRQFLVYGSHHTVDDLQAFTAQWVPSPYWVRTENVGIPEANIKDAAAHLTAQLGPEGIEAVGGATWWQWRREESPLEAEWIEMRKDYNERKQKGDSCYRSMLYVHGGAYFFGSVDEHRYQLQRHARKLQARVLAPRYRLAPQFPFPCGLLDCLAAYLFLLTVQPPETIVLAGDSAGGGMIVSLMVILRDQGLPLPAGAILVSPWVDLTHSFPSVAAENALDYIPAHGFHHKPSTSWPPPISDDLRRLHKLSAKDKGDDKKTPSIRDETSSSERGIDADHNGIDGGAADATPARQRPVKFGDLSIILDDKLVKLKDQIQMYTTNALLAHPLVSPVMQPSLGGLPPMFVLTGGGEMLRDEQIYLAHKAAAPAEYPPTDEYLSAYPGSQLELKKWAPTNVQLQVWDDLCHVAPTLSFTRPAKFMYRSIAQFGAWVLARAQQCDMEIMDDDDISIISDESSDSDSTSVSEGKESAQGSISTRSGKSRKAAAAGLAGTGSKDSPFSAVSVGKAGDPLPPFQGHMIRQRVSRHGEIYPLPPAASLAACMQPPSAIGVIKPGPVRKWMDAHAEWMVKFAKETRSVQQQRLQEMADAHGDAEMVGAPKGERPPPTAFAGRRRADLPPVPRRKRGRGLAVWSGWGSHHDEETIERQEQLEEKEGKEPATQEVSPDTQLGPDSAAAASSSRRRTRSNARVKSVTDQGQTGSGRPLVAAAGVAEESVVDEAGEGSGAPLVAENSAQRPAIGNQAFPFKLARPVTGDVNPSTVTLNAEPGVLEVNSNGDLKPVDDATRESPLVVDDGKVFEEEAARPEPTRFVTAAEVPQV